MYKDLGGGAALDAPSEGRRLLPPRGYSLVYRDDAVTIWWPQAQQVGYGSSMEMVWVWYVWGICVVHVVHVHHVCVVHMHHVW